MCDYAHGLYVITHIIMHNITVVHNYVSNYATLGPKNNDLQMLPPKEALVARELLHANVV